MSSDSSCNDTISVTFDSLGPTFGDVEKCPPPEWLPLVIIGAVLFAITCAIFAWVVWDFSRFKWSHTFQYTLTCYILWVYVAFGGLNLISMLNLRGGAIYEFVADIAEGIGMICMYHLICLYAGNLGELKTELAKVKVSLGSPPLCCLKLCSSLVPATQKFFTVVWCLVLQLPALQITLGLITVTAWYNENSGSSVMGDTNSKAMIIIGILLSLSFPVAVYGICLLDSALQKYYKGSRNVMFKFTLFKAIIGLQKIQTLIFTAAGGDVKSYGYVSSTYRVKIWNQFLVILESMVILFIASFAYHRSDFDTFDQRISQVQEPEGYANKGRKGEEEAKI